MNTKMRRWTIIGIDTFFVIGFLTVMVLPFGVIGHTIRTIENSKKGLKSCPLCGQRAYPFNYTTGMYGTRCIKRWYCYDHAPKTNNIGISRELGTVLWLPFRWIFSGILPIFMFCTLLFFTKEDISTKKAWIDSLKTHCVLNMIPVFFVVIMTIESLP